MAIKELVNWGDKDAGRPEAAGPQMTVAAPPRSVSPSTSVDASTELKGTLRCKETLRIDGRIEGSVECEKNVLVGAAAKVRASITSEEVTVSGLVQGDITARRKITLEKTAIVKGDLTTPGIVIEEGAKLKGRIVIGSDAEELQDEKPAQEPKKAPAAKRAAAAPAKSTETPAAAASA